MVSSTILGKEPYDELALQRYSNADTNLCRAKIHACMQLKSQVQEACETFEQIWGQRGTEADQEQKPREKSLRSKLKGCLRSSHAKKNRRSLLLYEKHSWELRAHFKFLDVLQGALLANMDHIDASELS